MSKERLIGYREFVDGPRRPIWEDEKGQYVVDEDGVKVRGVYLIPEDAADLPVTLSADLGE